VRFFNLSDNDLAISLVDYRGKVPIYNEIIYHDRCKSFSLYEGTIYLVYIKYLDDIENIIKAGTFIVDPDAMVNIVFELENRYKMLDSQGKPLEKSTEMFTITHGRYRPRYNLVSFLNKTNESIYVQLIRSDDQYPIDDFSLPPKTAFQKVLSNAAYETLVKYEKVKEKLFKGDKFKVRPSYSNVRIIYDENRDAKPIYTLSGVPIYSFRIYIFFSMNTIFVQ
jgi:hypothetical protein